MLIKLFILLVLACHVISFSTSGTWMAWSPWSKCSISCGGGWRGRSRNCAARSYQMLRTRAFKPICVGDKYQRESCNNGNCFGNYGNQNQYGDQGHWGHWGAWSSPSASCGDQGVLVARDRKCIGFGCYGDENETKNYPLPLCPINGCWSEWGSWSKTTRTCGENPTVYRNRKCNSPPPSGGGRDCPGESQEKKTISLHPCPIDGNWSLWSSWSVTMATCIEPSSPLTFKSKSRVCNNPAPAFGGKSCQGNDEEKDIVLLPPCPINGGWSAWTSWSSNSLTCAEEQEVVEVARQRFCSNPYPSNHGQGCAGEKVEKKKVYLPKCPIDGWWSSWSAWTSPSVNCISGTPSSSLSSSPFSSDPSPFSSDPSPFSSDSSSFSSGPSPFFSSPSSLSPNNQGSSLFFNNNSPISDIFSFPAILSSSTSSSKVFKTRTRNCDNPSPSFGGKSCQGNSQQSHSIFIPYCPIDGCWTKWSYWSSVKVTCSDQPIVIRRSRSCSAPFPNFGGKFCDGKSLDFKKASVVRCPIDGKWSEWSDWSTIHVTCSKQPIRIERRRTCTNPSPNFGGRFCTGRDLDFNSVNLDRCPINGAWSQWSHWSEVKVTCSNGPIERRRIRSCTNPSPQFGGLGCLGNQEETKQQFLHKCPIDGGWSYWTPWSKKTGKCGPEEVKRSRSCDNPTPQYGGQGCHGLPEETKMIQGRKCYDKNYK